MATAWRDRGTTCGSPLLFSCFVRFIRADGIFQVRHRDRTRPIPPTSVRQGAHEHQWRKLQRCARNRRTSVRIDGSQQFADAMRFGDGRHVFDVHRPKSSRQGSGKGRARPAPWRWHIGKIGRTPAWLGARLRSPLSTRCVATQRAVAALDIGDRLRAEPRKDVLLKPDQRPVRMACADLGRENGAMPLARDCLETVRGAQAPVAFSALRCMLGSIPDAKPRELRGEQREPLLRLSSPESEADEFVLAWNRCLWRHHRFPAGVISRYSPAPSKSFCVRS